MNKLISFITTFIVTICFVSCNGNLKTKNKDSNVQTETEIKKDSVQNEEHIRKDVDIPRSHLGISLGMPWSEAKQVLASNGWDNLPEKIDDVYKTIKVESSWHADNDKLVEEFKGKYSDFYIEVFDNKVYSISLLPKDNQEDIIEALKQKYPFDKENHKEYSYWNGSATTRDRYWYSYSNGETEISLIDYSSRIWYYDVKLKIAAAKYRDEVDTKLKTEKERNVNDRVSSEF